MDNRNFEEFSALLDAAYDLIGAGQNKTISSGAKAMFFKAMGQYSIEQFRMGLNGHCMDKQRGRFTPKPADIIEQIEGATGGDGRPSDDEAWAIALTSQDESDTVVWTQETAEAFAICRPVLEIGDKVGARMAFKESYARLVQAARQANIRTQWAPSLGWDLRKREAALTKAATVGLLAAPVVAGLLPPPEAAAQGTDSNARAQLAAIKEMIATMGAEKQREAELHAQRERDATAAAKQRANDLVAQHEAAK